MVNKFFQNHWLHIILFFGVFITTMNTKLRMPQDPNRIGLAIIIFLLLLYIASIYEITIKIGIKKEFSQSKILSEIIIVWILPLVLGFFII